MLERAISLSGRGDALRVQFPYRPEVVDGVKRIPGRKFHSAACVCGKCEPPRPYWSIPFQPAVVPDVLIFANQFGFAIDPRVREFVELGERRAAQEEEAQALPDDIDIDLGGAEAQLYPFQRVGVEYAVRRQRVLIGDEPGLGKTIQALCAIKYLAAYPAVIVCPATLKRNWSREAFKWLPGRFVQTFEKSNSYVQPADVLIVNYDLLKGRHENPTAKRVQDRGPFLLEGLALALKDRQPRMLVLDESHYIKSTGATRTKACKALAKGVPFRILLSGTPILNRPKELKTQLQVLGWLKEFGGAVMFERLYCNAHKGPRGYDANGASNLQALNRKLRSTCFIRRRKRDVYTQLPPKQHAQITLEISNRQEYDMAADNLREWLLSQGMFTQARSAVYAEQLARVAYLKRLAARGKMKAACEWIDDFLDDSEEKLVLFAWHQEIVQALADRYHVRPIFGPTPLAERQRIIDDFQTGDTRVIVLNMQAGGVGLTLTAASNVVFLELGWTPAIHEQAEDRTHRIGQDDQVTAWYLVGEQTIDEDILEILAEKRVIVGAATDGENGEEASMLNELIGRLAGRRSNG